MGLKTDIEKAYDKALGGSQKGSGNIPTLAQDLSDAIINFLQAHFPLDLVLKA